MSAFIEILALIPKGVQIVIASGVLGGAGFYVHEVRYMTVSDYTKGYVLDLKSEIRQILQDVNREDLDPQVREILQEQLDELLAELCYERPDDPYCEE